MLKFMRKYATGYLVKALFGLIIVVFIFWGVGSYKEGDKTVAEVGPHKISMIEYQDMYKKTWDFYRMLYKDKFDDTVVKELKLKERVMDQLVDRYLLVMKAAELGLSVSDKEFLEFVSSTQAFQRDGRFDQQAYVDVLKRNGMDPKKFEESEKVNLLTMKLVSIIRDNGAFLNDSDIWASYVKDRGLVNLAYTEFDPASFTGKVTVEEKEISDLYEKEKASHKGENTYHLKYVVIDEKSQVKDDVAYMELLKVKNIDAYGKEKGFEVFDLGSLKEGEVGKRLKGLKSEEWLKGLKKGDISLPVRSDTRSYIFQLVDTEEGKPIDKVVVMKEIRERIVSERAKALTKTQAENTIRQKSFTSRNETGFIPRSASSIAKIGPVPKDGAGVLALSDKQPVYEKPVEISGKFYVFSFKEEKLPDKAQWDKEREPYKRALSARNQEDFFKSFMEEMRKKTKVNIYWQEI